MREVLIVGGRLAQLVRAFGKWSLAVLAATYVASALAAPAPKPQAPPLPFAAQACLDCHEPEQVGKFVAAGKPLARHSQVEELQGSVHADLDCTDCHADRELLPPAGADRKSKQAREFAIAMSENCRDCHKQEAKKGDGSIHAARLRDQQLQAPVCADCHTAHSVNRKVVEGDACLACHNEALGLHAKWLPNTRRHLEAVACAVCHAPAGKPMVVLALVDRGTRRQVAQGAGAHDYGEQLAKADAAGDGLDPVELRALLGMVNADEKLPPVGLRGRMELMVPADEHGLADNTKALRLCASCHVSRADAFQRVALSYIDAEGKRVRYPAQREVLTSIYSIDSLREFYVIGGTRIELLDLVLLMAVCGGIAMPIGHQLIRRLVVSQGKSQQSSENDQTKQ
jgi:hypothetical protein